MRIIVILLCYITGISAPLSVYNFFGLKTNDEILISLTTSFR
jgi:hypothetical protein